jgi:two-component system invasion response regulator UvrY
MLRDEAGITVAGEAASGEEAIELVQKVPVDVILMDVRMPGIGDIEAVRRIQRLNDNIKVIAVTACDDAPFPARLMKAGASAFITKGADLAEMIEAIHLVVAGKRYISPEIAQKMALKPYDEIADEDVFKQLSEREMQVVLMIVGCQKVQDISDKLCLSPKTVNTYRYRIFEKLNINSDVELTLLAIRHGMVDTKQLGADG